MPRLRAFLPLAAAALAACGNYAHDNPVDPGYAIRVSLQGPDTIIALGDVLRLHYTTDRPWTGPAPQFTTENPYVAYTSDSVLGVITAHFPGQTIATVRLGAHEASTTIWVIQVPVWASVARCDSGSLTLTTLTPVTMCVSAVDRGGHPIAFYFPGYAPVLRSRNPAIVSVDSATMVATPHSNGSTWLVATVPPVVDSVLVTVAAP
jgi:hypothetical protein